MANSHDGWIGVDLDGTLAVYDRWCGPDHIGKPIPVMVERVKGWLAEGKSVRILTARVSSSPTSPKHQRDAAEALIAIQDWCLVNIGQVIPVVCTKDYAMIEFWDDRCVQVERNTGRRIDEPTA